MATFQLFGDKRRLKNAQHFAFIQAFITALQQSGMTAQKIQALALALTPALAVQAQTQEAQVPTPAAAPTAAAAQAPATPQTPTHTTTNTAAATPMNKPINNQQITNKK